jgi:hypothetical protein
MDHAIQKPDVPAPAPRLAATVALWGAGAALLACAVASSRGVVDAAVLAAACAALAAVLGFAVLAAIRPRPLANWAMPVLLAQMIRTGLAPVFGLPVFLLAGVDPAGFWLSLLAVAAAMLIGETVFVSRMFGSAALGSARGGEVAA